MIADFHNGQTVTAFFILRHAERRFKKEGGEAYWSLELGDASGRIFASLWDEQGFCAEQYPDGTPVKVRGTVVERNGRLYLNIEKIRPAADTDDISPAELVPLCAEPLDRLLRCFEETIDEVKEPHLRELLRRIVDEPSVRERLTQAPAGKLWHHCCIGGLLVHTLNVVRLARAAAEIYPRTDLDLLTAGALLHDIGKLFEYRWERFIDYSDDGRLEGHIAIGFHIVASCIDAMSGFPDELRRRLLHLILAHHGCREQGSPTVPMTREAFILSRADDLDAQLGAFERVFEQEYRHGKKWSSYVNLLDRYFYFGDERLKLDNHEKN